MYLAPVTVNDTVNKQSQQHLKSETSTTKKSDNERYDIGKYAPEYQNSVTINHFELKKLSESTERRF